MDKLCGMRLPAMAHARRNQGGGSSGIADMTFDERLAMIVDAEWDARRSSKRTRLLRTAGFPDPDANVADMRHDADRKLDKAKMAEPSNRKWVRSCRNVTITGASGAGKIWIACALGEGTIDDTVIDRIACRSETIRIEGDESMRKRIG